MKKTPWGTRILLVCLLILALLSGYNYFFTPAASMPWFQPSASPQPIASESSTLDGSSTHAILAQLSAREKIWQLLAVPITITPATSATPSGIPVATEQWLLEQQPGSVVFFGTTISTSSAQRVQTQVKAAYDQAKLQPLTAVDHEGGRVSRFNGAGFTRLPSWSALCQVEQASATATLNRSAVELRTAGIDVVFAPVVDVTTAGSPLTDRTCSSEPSVIVDRSLEYITAFKNQNILPVIKHFPGIGQADNDLHFNFDQVELSTNDVEMYRSILSQHPDIGVMVGHVGVVNQYPDIPCSLSEACVTELKNTYPETLIFTDSLDMVAASYNPSESTGSTKLAEANESKSLSQVAEEAVLAGNTILVFGTDTSTTELEQVADHLVQLYNQSASFAQKVDDSVQKIVNYKEAHP